MKITLTDGREFEIEDADGLIDEEISNLSIAKMEHPDGLVFTNTDHLLAYLEFVDKSNDQKIEAMLYYLTNVAPQYRDEDYISEFDEAYQGHFSSEAEFAEKTATEIMSQLEDQLPAYLYPCIDWEKYWRNALRHEYYQHSGHFYKQ